MDDLLKTIGGTLLKIGAPTLGTAIGGSLGGIIAKTAADAVADALGVPSTPTAINDALNTDPAAAAKIQAVEQSDEWRATYAQAAQAQSADINQTIRQENQGVIDGKISRWHWRHLLGYVVGGWIAGVAAAFVKHMWLADAKAIGDVVLLMNSGFGYFGAACGLLGYVAMDTTRFKTAVTAGSEVPTITGAVIKAFSSKK